MRQAGKVVFLCALVLFCTAALRAETIPDPVIDVSDPFCFLGPACPNPVFTNTFTFSSNLNGGGFFTFTNLTGHTVTELTMQVPISNTVFVGNITCTTDAFQFCTLSSDALFVYIVFSGTPCDGIERCGWVANQLLNVDLTDLGNQDPNGGGGWGPTTTVVGTASTVPEPATFALLASGASLLWRRRKR